MKSIRSCASGFFLVALSCALVPVLGAEAGVGPPAGLADRATPEQLARQYIDSGEWVKLDALMNKVSESGERTDDGRHRLYFVTNAIVDLLCACSERENRDFERKLNEYDRQVPGSAFAPILRALQLRQTAWRARGNGYSSTVTEEGWRQFNSFNAKAWSVLQEGKERAAKIPTWYEYALLVAEELDMPGDHITALFNEGIRGFPGYHPLYFNYTRRLMPKWGGDYESARRFIEAQVAAKTNPEGEVLYARLYWLVDQYGYEDADFFQDSLVEWPRMRNGFELLMKQFPKSHHNQANFAAFACRAGDGKTYLKWVKGLTAEEFDQAARHGISRKGCTARFTTNA